MCSRYKWLGNRCIQPHLQRHERVRAFKEGWSGSSTPIMDDDAQLLLPFSLSHLAARSRQGSSSLSHVFLPVCTYGIYIGNRPLHVNSYSDPDDGYVYRAIHPPCVNMSNYRELGQVGMSLPGHVHCSVHINRYPAHIARIDGSLIGSKSFSIYISI